MMGLMDTTNFKESLEKEKQKLESEMAGIGRKNSGVPNDWESVPPEVGTEADLIDQADAVVSRDTNSAIFNDLEARYDSVLEALSAIEKGTYGLCGVCGKKIERERLDADPAATTCMEHV